MRSCSSLRKTVFISLFCGLFGLTSPLWPAAQTSTQLDPFYLRLLAEGEQSFKARDFGQAVKTLNVASFGLIQDRSLSSKALAYISLSYFNLKDDARAKDALERLLETVGTSGLSGVAIGEEDRGNLAKLVTFFKLDQPSVKPPTPDRTDSLASKSPAKQQTKSATAPDTVKTLEARIKAQPRNVQVHLDLYEYRLRMKDMKGARKALENLESKVPGDATAPFLLGKMSYAARDYKEAVESFGRVLAIKKRISAGDKDTIESAAYIILAYNHLKKKSQLDQACRDFLGRFSPGDLGYTGLTETEKGFVKNLLGKVPGSQAKTVASPQQGPPATAAPAIVSPKPTTPAPAPVTPDAPRATNKDPDDVSHYYGLYDLYRQRNDRAGARQAIQNLIKTDPTEAKAYLILGKLDYEDKAFGEAASGLRRIFALPATVAVDDSLRGEAAYYLILSLLQGGDRAAAQEVFAANRERVQGFASTARNLDPADTVLWQGIYGKTEPAPASAPQSSVQVQLRDVRLVRSSSGVEVNIDLSGPAMYRTFLLTSERSVVIEFFHVAASQAPDRIDVNKGGVKSIRTFMFEPDKARVILEGTSGIPKHKVVKTDSGVSIVIEGPSAPGS